MATLRLTGFATRNEAEAFRAGVEFVNDSRVEVLELNEEDWTLLIVDRDDHDDRQVDWRDV